MAERETLMMGSVRMTMSLPSMYAAPKSSLSYRVHADSRLSYVGTTLYITFGLQQVRPS